MSAYRLEDDALKEMFNVSGLYIQFGTFESPYRDVSFTTTDRLNDKTAGVFKALALTGLIETAEVGTPTLNITGNLRLGSTTLTEPQLVALLALLSSS
jgi:hypothetical protein